LAPGVSRLDTNRDGLISRDEAKASTDLSARFGELDKNRDGSLSADEISNASSAPSGGSSPMKR
jgi:Ca2+-binding EF-hand superfamily protein